MYVLDGDRDANNIGASSLWQGVQHSDRGGAENASRTLEQLLQYSRGLDLQEGYITPVQVWDLIRSQSSGSVTAGALGQITAELCKHATKLMQVI
jgi:hypothetical protein